MSYYVMRPRRRRRPGRLQQLVLYIPQRGVQWKQGVVIYMTLYTSLLYNTTPIHRTPDPLHPPCRVSKGVGSPGIILLILIVFFWGRGVPQKKPKNKYKEVLVIVIVIVIIIIVIVSRSVREADRLEAESARLADEA